MSNVKPDLVTFSSGCGVQSSTIVEFIADGTLPKPDAVIFADTQSEPQHVYDWIETYIRPRLDGAGVPFITCTGGSLTRDIEDGAEGNRAASMPVFTETTEKRRANGRMRRQCTKEYKTEPVRIATRELLGLKSGEQAKGRFMVENWIGISTDEIMRMKPHREAWITNRWPLIELRMSRADCLRLFDDRGLPRPPKSSCVYCPNHDDTHWREIQDRDPAGFAEAVRVDGIIRDGVAQSRQDAYLHRQLIPLDQVDLSTAEERGQLTMFNNECEGVCGT